MEFGNCNAITFRRDGKAAHAGFGGSDHREAADAFHETRAPNFTGE